MYRSLLVPVDLDQPASWNEALSTASSLAKCFSAKITVCSVVSGVEAIKQGEWLPISVEQAMFDAQARLEGLVATAIGDASCGVEIAAGTIAGGILEIAERIAADLIVLVSHQPSARDYFLGANAIRVARRAPCSVLITRHGDA
jgi:nucleotide-binding universal stress UspA family protein